MSVQVTNVTNNVKKSQTVKTVIRCFSLQPKVEKNCASVNDIFPQLEFSALTRPVDQEDIDFIYSGLQTVDQRCALTWILMPESSVQSTGPTLFDLTVKNILKKCIEAGGDISTAVQSFCVI